MAWFDKLSHLIKKYGLKHAQVDHTFSITGMVMNISLLLVFIDEINFTNSNASGIER